MDRVIEKKKWTSKKIAAIVGGAILLLFILYLIFFQDKSSKLYIEKEKLSIDGVVQGPFQEFIPVDGIVQPKTTIFVDAVFGGRVEEIYVRDGAMVEKDERILRLSNSSLQMDYMNRENQLYDVLNNLQNSKLSIEQNRFTLEKQLVEIDYQLDKARLDFYRKEKLYADKLISSEVYENAKRDLNYLSKQKDIAVKSLKHDSIFTIAQMGQIRESINRMQNNLVMLKSNLDNLVIKAPVSGQLSGFNSEIGETKSAGENLARIDVPQGYKLRARIDERYVNRTSIGQEAEFEYEGKTFYLTVSKIYSDVKQGSFEVDLFFVDNIAPESIRRGQTIQLKLKFSGLTDAITIPRGGFYQQTGGNWIFVVDESGSYAVKRQIKIGRQNIYRYEVLEGLEAGEKVIVSSYESFGDKDKIVFK
ncbi:MAG: HlyD family efflux transporter periplasmic adaptor subunit [Bacteroidales bacterium]|nr:HlyD family efflux transporter periplasmic adaptor subunit [Bacteroidales bacterium]